MKKNQVLKMQLDQGFIYNLNSEISVNNLIRLIDPISQS